MDFHLSDSLMLEAAVRFTSVGLYLATAIIIFRLRVAPARIVGFAAYLSKAAHAVVQFTPAMILAAWAAPLLLGLGAMGSALTWLFALELYSDQNRFDRRRLIPPAVVMAIVVAAISAGPPHAKVLWLLHAFSTVVLMTHLLVFLASSWRNDLVERRRLIATPVFALSAVYSITLGFIQTMQAFENVPRQPSLTNALILLCLSTIAITIFGQFGAALFGDERDEVIANPKGARPTPPVTMSVADANLVAALERLMTHDRVYRTQSLKITDLARMVKVPEHRLRHLLNYTLGYRNFNAYIARWRIAEAKQALLDPDQVEVPISTIAIDSGFQSLAPFNRAFKTDTGMTPSEFRADGLGFKSTVDTEVSGARGSFTPAAHVGGTPHPAH